MQRLKPLQNSQFGSIIKNAKNMRKLILQEYKYCKNETIFKIANLANVIALGNAKAFAKWSVLVNN